MEIKDVVGKAIKRMELSEAGPQIIIEFMDGGLLQINAIPKVAVEDVSDPMSMFQGVRKKTMMDTSIDITWAFISKR